MKLETILVNTVGTIALIGSLYITIIAALGG